jgi:hypothetical protein
MKYMLRHILKRKESSRARVTGAESSSRTQGILVSRAELTLERPEVSVRSLRYPRGVHPGWVCPERVLQRIPEISTWRSSRVGMHGAGFAARLHPFFFPVCRPLLLPFHFLVSPFLLPTSCTRSCPPRPASLPAPPAASRFPFTFASQFASRRRSLCSSSCSCQEGNSGLRSAAFSSLPPPGLWLVGNLQNL